MRILKRKKKTVNNTELIKDVLNMLFNGAIIAYASLLNAACCVWTHVRSTQLLLGLHLFQRLSVSGGQK